MHIRTDQGKNIHELTYFPQNLVWKLVTIAAPALSFYARSDSQNATEHFLGKTVAMRCLDDLHLAQESFNFGVRPGKDQALQGEVDKLFERISSECIPILPHLDPKFKRRRGDVFPLNSVKFLPLNVNFGDAFGRSAHNFSQGYDTSIDGLQSIHWR